MSVDIRHSLPEGWFRTPGRETPQADVEEPLELVFDVDTPADLPQALRQKADELEGVRGNVKPNRKEATDTARKIISSKGVRAVVGSLVGLQAVFSASNVVFEADLSAANPLSQSIFTDGVEGGMNFYGFAVDLGKGVMKVAHGAGKVGGLLS